MHYDAISNLAVKVLGQEAIDAMSDPQLAALSGALGRISERYKTHETVTENEIVGAYEIVVDHVLPNV